MNINTEEIVIKKMRGRQKGCTTKKLNYKLKCYNFVNKMYDECGLFSSFHEMELYFNEQNIDVTSVMLANIYNKRTKLYNFIQIEHI